MKTIFPVLAIDALALVCSMPAEAVAQADDARLDEIERRLNRVERQSLNNAAGVAAFVSAAFCALWAQQTRRNAWLWFFLGLFFNVITLLVLLYKNSQDIQQRQWAADHEWTRNPQ